MSSRRRTWLTRIGMVLLLLLLIAGALVARYASQRAEHQRLRELEVGRAPSVAPRRLQSSLLPAPVKLSCLHGVVIDHGAPVAGMQVSVSAAPFTVSGDCPCTRSVSFCGCREGVAMLPRLPRAGLVEAVQSAISDEGGRFELCGLEGDGRRLIWGEHLDGRLAVPPFEHGPFTRPGESLELQVFKPIPAQGVVLSKQSPVPGATVLAYSRPPLFVRSFTTDARGRFETALPPGTSDFVVSGQLNGKDLSTQRVNQLFSPQQVLVLRLKSEGELIVRALEGEAPVAGAEVTLPSEDPVLTDAQGLARFPIAATARVQVKVTKGELIGAASVNVLEGQPRRIDLKLVKGLELRGVVVDEQGQPRQGKVVGFGGQPVLTDEQGRFSSPLLAASADLWPSASVEGCADSPSEKVQLSDAPAELTLKVACAEAANGVVVDAEGKPVKGAVVFLDGRSQRESVTTDATGTFRFHQPSGIYQLKISHDRYRSQEQPLQLPAKDVTIVLDAGGSISGRVVDAKGVGVAGARVLVVPAVLDALLGEVESGPSSAETDSDGRFSVTGLLAGRLVASATADSMGTVVSEVVVLQPAEHHEGLVLTLEERVDVSGTVTDEQRQPIPGARVSWDPADEKAALVGLLMDAVRGHVDEVLRFMPSPSVTDAEGHYALHGLPVSKVKLSVNAAGYAELEQVASRGDRLDFVLKKEGGRIRGRVVEEGGRPLAQFAVDDMSFTPEDGRFEVDAYGNEDLLSITAPGFSRQSLRLTVDTAVKDVGDVVMKKAKQLRVEVRSEEGAPLPQVRVAAVQSVDGDDCTTRDDGACVIEPLLDVETRVKAIKDGYTPVSVTLPPGKIDQPLTLTLAPAGGRITGVAFATPGRPAPARNVFIAGDVTKGILTDAEGKFTAEGLPEGKYCASLESHSLHGLEWAVSVQASTAPAEVQLGPVAQGGVVTGARTLPGRLVLVRGAAAALPIGRVMDARASSLCDSTSSAVITTITTGDFRVEGVPPGRWSAFHVGFSQVGDQGDVQPVAIELLAGETKSIP